MGKNGKIISPGVLCFERVFNSTIDKVWTYLTDSEKRGKWLAKGEMELFEGGSVTLHFMHSELSPIPGSPPEMHKAMEAGHTFTGKVIEIDPPHRLTFTWHDDSEVTFELSTEAAGVKMVLTHRKLSDSDKIRIMIASGWHTHLEVLEANLNGTVPENFWVIFEKSQQAYSVGSF
jgi:uncharacterized protein YndB with AHSA1/START domain